MVEFDERLVEISLGRRSDQLFEGGSVRLRQLPRSVAGPLATKRGLLVERQIEEVIRAVQRYAGTIENTPERCIVDAMPIGKLEFTGACWRQRDEHRTRLHTQTSTGSVLGQ
ncbi:hypothetical protein ACFPRL_13570 [Pseudoclavibacter helvolus]